MLSHPVFDQKESQFVYDACYAAAKEALRSGYLVVLDGTFMRDEYRSEVRNRLRRSCTRMDFVWVDCLLATALERNSLRESPIPPEKVEGIHGGFQKPKRAVRVDSTILDPGAAASLIAGALGLGWSEPGAIAPVLMEATQGAAPR